MPSSPTTAGAWRARGLGFPVFLSAAYLAGAELGGALSLPNSFATFWPPSGLLVGALLLADPRRWPVLVAAVLPANLVFDLRHGHPAAASLAYWAANALEGLVGAWLVRRAVGTRCTLARIREVAALVVLSALGSTTLGATVGAAAAVLHGGGSYWTAWQIWWVGDAVGIVLFAPVILTWAEPGLGLPSHRRVAEWGLFLSALVLMTAGLLGGAPGHSRFLLPLPFVFLPVLAWAAWRFGPRGTALGVLTVGLVATWNHLHGRGVFVAEGGPTVSSVATLKAFASLIAVTFLGLAASITERKRAVEALYESERRFRTMADGIQVVLWLGDLEGRCEFVNQAWYNLTGRPVEEALGEGWWARLHPDDRDALLASYRAAVPARAPFRFEYRLRGADGGYHWMLGVGTPRLDRDGTCLGYIGSALDISDRKQAELERQQRIVDEIRARARAERLAAELGRLNEQLAEARDAVQEASRLKSQFLANMSHEIRTPMTAIVGFAELLADYDGKVGDRPRLVEKIRWNAEHLLRLIGDILDLSKFEAGQMVVDPVPCSPLALVAEVASLMRVRAAEKGLVFEVEYRGPIPERITTDPTRFRQILLNLVGNAIKFTPSGAVRIVVTLVGAECLSVAVRDTGVGIAADVQTTIFEPFAQADASTSRRFGGTGLGLAIVRRLAHLLGGDIALESAPGEGSVFTLTLATGPLDGARLLAAPQEAGCEAGAAARAGREALAPGSRVLLAEDARDTQELIAFHLRQAGAIVEVAGNGVEARRMATAAAAAGSPFDVILMDMQMPLLDGYGATALLREGGYCRPIVAFTAHSMPGDREKCLDAGCDDFLTKPIDRDLLMKTVARWVGIARAAAGDERRERIPVPGHEGSGRLAALAARFLACLPERAAALERSLTDGDLDGLARLAHQLKGTAGAYGLTEISTAAADLETSARGRHAREEIHARTRSVAALCRRLDGAAAVG